MNTYLISVESDLHGENLLHDVHGLLLAQRLVLGAVLAQKFPGTGVRTVSKGRAKGDCSSNLRDKTFCLACLHG